MSNEEKEGPVSKKLRCSEPDLCVVVGQDKNKKEYRYHYQVLASHSNYIDTMLATPMKESQTMEVNFPDLTPDTWESMIGFLTDPVKAHDMNFADAMKVAASYNKYDFQGGLELCDRVMSELFERNLRLSQDIPRMKPDDDLNLLIEAFLLTDEAHLENAKKQAVSYFKLLLRNDVQYGSFMFTEHHIEQLAPLIAKESLLRDSRKERILNPLFPECFVATRKALQASNEIHVAVQGLKLSGTSCAADGKYKYWDHDGNGTFGRCEGIIRWGGFARLVKIAKLHDDWVIYGEASNLNKQIWWTSPYSSNMLLPPRDGWEPVDELATGNPTIEYN